MKVLRIGDPHVTVSNLKDSERLIDFVIETAKKEKVDRVEFLGDLFHTHAVMRVEVVHFWRRAFDKISFEGFPILTLVGNHDQPGSKEKEQQMNALNIYQSGDVVVVNKPMVIDQIAYIPYTSNREEFLKATYDLQKKGAEKLLVAHQTFTGATYENGFFAEDGIDPELVAQESVVSGHIHKQQQIGKCDYPGTPKWDTMSDANEEKGIWLYTHEKDGSVKNKKFFPTAKVVTPIYKITVNEGDDEPTLHKEARNYIEFVGKSVWITKMKKKYKGKAHIKARPTDRKTIKVDRENLQTIQSFLMSNFEVVDGVDKDDIKTYLEKVNEAI